MAHTLAYISSTGVQMQKVQRVGISKHTFFYKMRNQYARYKTLKQDLMAVRSKLFERQLDPWRLDKRKNLYYRDKV